jgi:hypothetical protein
MPDGGPGWLWHGAAARAVLLFVAGYALATAAALLALIVILARLPPTYFRDGVPVPAGRSGAARPAAIRVARNALGVLLIVLGFLLSLPLVPGQGVLTMLIGVILVDFPGKRRLERKLVARPSVLETMNRVRAWLGRPPLVP